MPLVHPAKAHTSTCAAISVQNTFAKAFGAGKCTRGAPRCSTGAALGAAPKFLTSEQMCGLGKTTRNTIFPSPRAGSDDNASLQLIFRL